MKNPFANKNGAPKKGKAAEFWDWIAKNKTSLTPAQKKSAENLKKKMESGYLSSQLK